MSHGLLVLVAALVAAAGASLSATVHENPSHDFPQRVGYRRNGPDSLYAWIEGTCRGQGRRIEFPYRRAACGGP